MQDFVHPLASKGSRGPGVPADSDEASSGQAVEDL